MFALGTPKDLLKPLKNRGTPSALAATLEATLAATLIELLGCFAGIITHTDHQSNFGVFRGFLELGNDDVSGNR